MPHTHTMDIKFCPDCKKRVGPVSTTHAQTGGNEARCQCVQAVDHPVDEPGKFETNPIYEESKQPEASWLLHNKDRNPVRVVMSPQQKTAQKLRTWTNAFHDLGVHSFPSCMRGISHLCPGEIYETLKLDTCDSRRRYVDARIGALVAAKKASCAWAAKRALLTSRHKAPACFNPFSAAAMDSSIDNECAQVLHKDEIWGLLSEEQKLLLLVDESIAKYDRNMQLQKVRAERMWIEQCTRCIRGGVDAIRENALHTPSKKRQIDDHFERARHNIRKRPKGEVDSITRDLFNGMDMDAWSADASIVID
jgi:hypothetical protein